MYGWQKATDASFLVASFKLSSVRASSVPAVANLTIKQAT
jgi:hypothetical protein